jgi:hypothetical protein
MTNNNALQLLVHVGYPKSASTWLQRQIFTNTDTGFCSPWGEQAKIAIEHILVKDTFVFDQCLNQMQDSYEEVILESNAAGLVPVISYEHFLVDPMGGPSNVREGVRRIKTLFPECKILLIIREQKSMILSAYLEHLRRGFPVSIERFLGCDGFAKPSIGCACPKELFLYNNLIKYLYENFCRENILVYPVEALRTANFRLKLNHLFEREVSGHESFEFSEAERTANKSDYVFLRTLNTIGTSRYLRKTGDSLLRKAAYGLNKYLNPITPHSLYEMRRTKFQSIIEKHIESFYDESNLITSELINYDLAELGYSIR